MLNYRQGSRKYNYVWASEWTNTVVIRFMCNFGAPVSIDSDRNAHPAMKDNRFIEYILILKVVHSTLI